MRMFSNDDAMVAALKANELDAHRGVPATAIKTLQERRHRTSRSSPGIDQTDFGFNSNPKKKKHRELLDPKLREAFAHAIDRKQIVDVVFLGHAQPGVSIIPPATGACTTQLKTESFDLGKANKMLDKLGYKKGSDGIRVGRRPPDVLHVITPTDISGIDRTFQIMQADFPKIGVKLTQQRLDSTPPSTRSRRRTTSTWTSTCPCGTGSRYRPRFHALRGHLRPVRRLERHRLLQQEYDKLYSQQQLTPDPAQAQADRLEDAGDPLRQAAVHPARDQDHVERVEQEWTGSCSHRRARSTRSPSSPDAGAPEVTIRLPEGRQSQCVAPTTS